MRTAREKGRGKEDDMTHVSDTITTLAAATAGLAAAIIDLRENHDPAKFEDAAAWLKRVDAIYDPDNRERPDPVVEVILKTAAETLAEASVWLIADMTDEEFEEAIALEEAAA